ncbi:MAG: fumarate hydratase [Anaerolineae bacterium]|nr:fumarate hydratase [Anaerolineae bacterium]MDW8067318.1 fumarate hydratase [Anaerolineae bacterium]
MEDLTPSLVELIRRASTDLPADVEAALRAARDREEAGSAAASALGAILENVARARARSQPICQDTGTPFFYVRYPTGIRARDLRAQMEAAVVEATRRAYLRPNAVDALTGRNSGNNLGVGFPVFHMEEGDDDTLEVALLLKGGGSENVSIQYSLPHEPLNAGRDLEGVRRVVLEAVYRAQGEGCAPGILGVCIGGDRGTGYTVAKRQLLRPLDDVHPLPELAALEQRLLQESNELGIGPMGFGGKTTILGVKIGVAHRLPASYFVTVAYMCWACRRARLTVRGDEVRYG